MLAADLNALGRFLGHGCPNWGVVELPIPKTYGRVKARLSDVAEARGAEASLDFFVLRVTSLFRGWKEGCCSRSRQKRLVCP